MADRLAAMARDLLEQDSLQATVDRIAAHAVDLVHGCDAAGILTLRRARCRHWPPPRTWSVPATGSRASWAKARASTRSPTTSPSSASPTSPHARTAGPATRPRPAPWVSAALFTRHETLAALNLYWFRPRSFTEAGEHLGWLLASHAAVAFAYACAPGVHHGKRHHRPCALTAYKATRHRRLGRIVSADAAGIYRARARRHCLPSHALSTTGQVHERVTRSVRVSPRSHRAALERRPPLNRTFVHDLPRVCPLRVHPGGRC
ncbi:GAF domain-containing protein [Streptomyces phaeoluteigriseus]|uniref:GAF domain-containing protein n=1 Tax=Streptomyces phaeoluteigriseus TaxID=114686 RepID=UPI00338D960D